MSQALDQMEADELLRLLREHAYKEGTFKLASGRTSDFYIDIRRVALSSRGHWKLGGALLEAVHAMDGEAVAGVALGGCPLASAVSIICSYRYGREMPALYVRPKAKDHGTKKLVEAPYTYAKGEQKVVLVEDVITSGGSTIRALKTLEAEGHTCVGVVVVIDREEGGVVEVAKHISEVRSLFQRRHFVT